MASATPYQCERQPLLGVAASRESDSAPSSRCIDGSRMTFCEPQPAPRDGSTWLSVRIPLGARVQSVSVWVYMPPGGAVHLAPVDIYLGTVYGEADELCARVSTEPSHGGVVATAVCASSKRSLGDYVTLRQAGGARRMLLSEVEVCGPDPRPWQTREQHQRHARRPGDVAAAIEARFANARPSDELSKAGVLLHAFDGYEEAAAPWDICHEGCRSGRVDGFSCSVVGRDAPSIFLGSHGAAGVVMAPASVEVACAYALDAATGGHADPCTTMKTASDGTKLTTTSLRAALEAQRDPTWRRAHQRASAYNEVLVTALAWDRSLPKGVEAFFFDGTPGLLAPIRQVRARFLAAYGLAPDDAPLVEYACATMRPAEIGPGTTCWVER